MVFPTPGAPMISDLTATLVAVGVAAVAMMAAVTLLGCAHRWGESRRVRPRLAVLDAAADVSAAESLMVHAAASVHRARRAAAAVTAARHRYEQAEQERARLEAVYDAARVAYGYALRRAGGGRTPDQMRQAQARREQARVVSQAALAAYRRGHLTLDQLHVLFGERGDTDAGRYERERLAIRLATEESLVRQRYAMACAESRVAGEALLVAQTAAAAYAREAHDAAADVGLAPTRQWLPEAA